MNITRSYHLAASVISLFEFLAEGFEDDNLEVCIHPHINGRERGFNIRILGRKSFTDAQSIFVYEHRNSDQIAITTSYGIEWQYITEDDYKHTEFFEQDVSKAVDFIFKFLIENFELSQEIELEE